MTANSSLSRNPLPPHHQLPRRSAVSVPTANTDRSALAFHSTIAAHAQRGAHASRPQMPSCVTTDRMRIYYYQLALECVCSVYLFVRDRLLFQRAPRLSTQRLFQRRLPVTTCSDKSVARINPRVHQDLHLPAREIPSSECKHHSRWCQDELMGQPYLFCLCWRLRVLEVQQRINRLL